MRLLFACVLVAALALPLAAADINGKWTGKVEFKTPDGNTDGGEAFADFKQSGETITGGAGQSEMEQVPIENGKLVGNKLTLQRFFARRLRTASFQAQPCSGQPEPYRGRY